MHIHIDGWKQHLCFSAAHYIPQHHRCSILHGHTYVISCTIYGTPDPNTQMIIDFNTLKKILRKLLEPLDHHILIPDQHSSVTKKNHHIIINNNDKTYTIPEQDCILLPIISTTAEHLARYLLHQLIKQLSDPHNIQKINLQIDEGLGQSATAEQTL